VARVSREVGALSEISKDVKTGQLYLSVKIKYMSERVFTDYAYGTLPHSPLRQLSHDMLGASTGYNRWIPASLACMV
jgi:hypothetical protein